MSSIFPRHAGVRARKATRTKLAVQHTPVLSRFNLHSASTSKAPSRGRARACGRAKKYHWLSADVPFQTGEAMALKEELREQGVRWHGMSFYQRFEHAVVVILIALIAIVIVAAVWSLALKVLGGLILMGGFDPADPAVFQSVFGMIFTVIIALEFKRSLQIVTERADTVVQVRAVILIAMLAIVRKLILLDLSSTHAQDLLALSAAILSLGAVYWLVRDQDRRTRA